MRSGFARTHASLRLTSERSSVKQGQRVTPAANQLAQQVGLFFRNLRQVFWLSREQVARKLTTRADVIAALEAADVRALPPWPETCRIVSAYAGFARLNPRPVLSSIEILIAQNQHATAAVPPTLLVRVGQCGALVLAVLGDFRANSLTAVSGGWNWFARGRQRTGKALFAVAAPIALLVLLTQTTIPKAAVSQLPAPVAHMVRGAKDCVTLQLAPVRNGLRWIDVADPRSRRGDKLRTAGQSD